MVNAYLVRADEESLARGERLLRLYPEIVKRRLAQTGSIVADLKRREAKGTFGKTPPETWPEGFKSWEQGKKIAWLIDSLDEVDDRHMALRGQDEWPVDHALATLLDIGDPAVPALIDAIEKDERLTRSVEHRFTHRGPLRILTVRETALTTVMSILHTYAFEVDDTRNLALRVPDGPAKTAARLREYWKAYGGLPYEERLMKTLADPKADFKLVRESGLQPRGSAKRLDQSHRVCQRRFTNSDG